MIRSCASKASRFLEAAGAVKTEADLERLLGVDNEAEVEENSTTESATKALLTLLRAIRTPSSAAVFREYEVWTNDHRYAYCNAQKCNCCMFHSEAVNSPQSESPVFFFPSA